MKQETYFKDLTIYLSGAFLFAIGLLAINYSVYISAESWVFWVCYLSMLLIGFGAFIKNKTIIESQLIIITVPVIIWLWDFFYHLFFSRSLWGVIDYFFLNLSPVARFVSLEHFFILPLGYLIWWLMPGRTHRSWLIASFQLVLIIMISALLTSPELNVNCAFKSCLSFISDDKFYIFYYWLIIFSSLALGTAIINIINYIRKKYNKSK